MTNVATNSAALTELKSDLTHLSKDLHEIYELMTTEMRQLSDFWQDDKYQEFVQGFQVQISKCEAIAARYQEWCTKVLAPTIENINAIEISDVGGSSSSMSNNSSVNEPISIESGSNGKRFREFYMGGTKETPA